MMNRHLVRAGIAAVAAVVGFFGVKSLELFERSIRVETKIESMDKSIAETNDNVKALVNRVDVLFSFRTTQQQPITVVKENH